MFHLLPFPFLNSIFHPAIVIGANIHVRYAHHTFAFAYGFGSSNGTVEMGPRRLLGMRLLTKRHDIMDIMRIVLHGLSCIVLNLTCSGWVSGFSCPCDIRYKTFHFRNGRSHGDAMIYLSYRMLFLQ